MRFAIESMNLGELPEITAVLGDPAVSSWLKTCLCSALSRDPVDAANDAEILFLLLERRCWDTLRLDAHASG